MKQFNKAEHKLKSKHNVIDCLDCGGHKLAAVKYRYRYAGDTANEWFVYCKKCGRQSDSFSSMMAAIAAWNSGNGSPGEFETDGDA